MRFVLILILLAGWAVTGWHAVNVGTDHKMLLGAPQIEKIIDNGFAYVAESSVFFDTAAFMAA